MTIIGSASVQIHALDNLFQAEVKAAVEKIKDVTLQVTAEFNDTEAKAKIDDLRARAEANAINLRATADINPADDDIQHLRHKHDGENIKLDVQAATTDAAAQIAYTARSRTVEIYPVVNNAALIRAKQVLESLAGINTLRSLKNMFLDLASGFDQASIKAVLLSSAVLGLASSLASLTAGAFGAGEGILQLVGFFAMAPTLIGAVTTTVVANHLAWNNFGDALSDNVKKSTKALALLPPNAREAAVEVKKLWTEIKKPVQGAFWDGMGTSLQDTLRVMGPILSSGLTDTATTLGKFNANVLDSFKQIAENKSLEIMFKNLNLGLDALGKGVKPLFDAFNKLGFVGSQYLPQFGKWMADLAIRFDNFITKAAAGGDIVRWIENAKSAMADIWRIGDGIVGIFQGITRALNAAGSRGLDGIGTSLLKVEKIVKGPVFQSEFSQIFNGALQGAHAFKEGLADLGKSLGNSSVVIGAMFTLAGGVVKNLLEGIAALISVDGFQTGVIRAFGAIKNAIKDLTPSFENLGGIIGDLLDIASKIFSSIPPVINNATTLIKGILDNLKGGFMDVVPVLMGFINTLITAFTGPLLAASKVIGDIATAFSKLPSGIQTALMALGLVLLLLPKITTALSNMQKGMKLAADGSDKAKGRYVWLNSVGEWAKNGVADVNKAFGNLKYQTAFGSLLAQDAMGNLKAAGSLAMSGFIGGVKSGIGALGFVASEIGTAFAKTGTQAVDFLKRNLSPLVPYVKEFAAGLAEGIKQGWLQNIGMVGDGVRGIGNTIKSMADTAMFNLRNIGLTAGVAAGIVRYHIGAAFDGAVNSVKNFSALTGAYLKDIGPSVAQGLKTVGSTFSGMADTAKFNLGNIGLYASVAAAVAKYHLTTAFDAAKTSTLSFASLGKAYLADFAATGRGHFGALKDGALNSLALMKAYMGPTMESMRAATQPLRNTLGYVWDDFYAKTIYMDKRFRDVVSGMSRAGSDIVKGFGAVGTQLGQMGSYAAAAYLEPVTRAGANAITSVKQTASGMVTEITGKVSTAAGAVSVATANAATSVRQTISGMGTEIAGKMPGILAGISKTAGSVRDTVAAAGQNLAGNFAPVGAAFQALGNSFKDGVSNIRTHLGNLGTSFGQLGSSVVPALSGIGSVTAAIGLNAASGLSLAVKGIMGVLGGPWGIALMTATTFISAFGRAQQETKADVDKLAASLDKQTGDITGTTQKNAADLLNVKSKNILGFDIGETALTQAKKLGLSTELITKAATGNAEAGDRLNQWQSEFNEGLKIGNDSLDGGEAAWKKFAASHHLGNMSLAEGVSLWNEINPKIQAVKDKLAEAQKSIRDVADATHTNTTQAAILSANYDTLASSTSSASDKFNALKANLDVLNGKQLTAADSQKAYQQTLSDSATAINKLNGENKDQVKGLVDVKGQIDFTKQAGRDFHTILEGQADSILKLGTTALDSALKNGKSATDARQAALDAMGPAATALATQLANLGLAQPQIDAIMKSFGLMPKDLQMALKVDGKDQAILDIASVKIAADAFSKGNYSATLAALPQAAKDAIIETYHLGKDVFAKGDYTAIMKAMDGTAGGREAAMAQILTYTGGDYKAFLKAFADRNSIKEASSFIDGAAYTRTALIRVVADADSVASANDYIRVHTATGGGGKYLHGGIVNGAGMQVFADGGFSSLSKALLSRIPSFANGSENHVAQIARGQYPFRIWAEPETGGEAYIPLALSKRSRSKQILELVARQFGFGLVQMFADGGFSQSLNAGPGSTTTASATGSAMGSGMSGPLVAVYPSAALDEEKVGNIAARSLWFELQNK